MRFAFNKIKNSGRALIHTFSIPVTFVFVYLDREGCIFVLVFFYCHDCFSRNVDCLIHGLNVSDFTRDEVVCEIYVEVWEHKRNAVAGAKKVTVA
jgi:hypothetical protein